ncbi:4Fe-4S dicluster domain-containing protein [Lentisphaerota bacterium WC36G]|nr:4Fe-4S binding protein [Lentisphaerae bacterium WC36]
MASMIIKINHSKCIGCGKCVNACHQGAIELKDGKATLVSDDYCDGLGACIGDCPQGALTLEERKEDDNQAKVKVEKKEKKELRVPPLGGCPGMQSRIIERQSTKTIEVNQDQADLKVASQLTQWPVQLKLVPTSGVMWENANILIAADCTAFSLGSFHLDLLQGRKLVIACPKLDSDMEHQAEKLAEIIKNNDIKSVSVARMEVPCCRGIVTMVQKALEIAEKELDFTEYIIGIEGDIQQ